MISVKLTYFRQDQRFSLPTGDFKYIVTAVLLLLLPFRYWFLQRNLSVFFNKVFYSSLQHHGTILAILIQHTRPSFVKLKLKFAAPRGGLRRLQAAGARAPPAARVLQVRRIRRQRRDPSDRVSATGNQLVYLSRSLALLTAERDHCKMRESSDCS